MLTVIYVHEPATLTIEARDPRDERAILRRYDRQPARMMRAIGAVALERGVYAILSREALQLERTSGRVEISTRPGDEWPDRPELSERRGP